MGICTSWLKKHVFSRDVVRQMTPRLILNETQIRKITSLGRPFETTFHSAGGLCRKGDKQEKKPALKGNPKGARASTPGSPRRLRTNLRPMPSRTPVRPGRDHGDGVLGAAAGGGTAVRPGAAVQEAAASRKTPSSPATRWLAGAEEGRRERRQKWGWGGYGLFLSGVCGPAVQ